MFAPNNPLVSVIIPTYKRSDYLIRAIESVLRQTYSPIEIIVVDDNDGDNEFRAATIKNLNPYIENNQVKYCKHDYNMGLPAARNTGIKNSAGKYISFLDDDDEFLPEKTALQVHCFQNLESNVGLVYGSYSRIDTKSNSSRIIRPKHRGDLHLLLGLNHIGPPSMVMCTKEAIEKIEGFDETFLHREDIDFYYRIAKFYKIEFVEEVIIKYYIHSQVLSNFHNDKLTYMILFMNRYEDELKTPPKRWSELQERLGELYAINGNRTKALHAFWKSFINRPKRLSILIKAMLSLFGGDLYKKYRNIA